MIAHFHAVSEDPGFAVPGELPSRLQTSLAWRLMARGRMGTDGEYDFALKGLVLIVHRYRALLSDDDILFYRLALVPDAFTGGHNPKDEVVETPAFGLRVPETRTIC